MDQESWKILSIDYIELRKAIDELPTLSLNL